MSAMSHEIHISVHIHNHLAYVKVKQRKFEVN